MKWLLRSVSAVAVSAALAVPFIQSSVDQQQSGSRQASDSSHRSSSVNHVHLLPPVGQALSSKTTDVPDFSDIFDVNERKRAFFAYLLPAVEEVNSRVEAQRAALFHVWQRHEQGKSLTRAESQWLERLSNYYQVDEEDLDDRFAILLRRVDIVPSTLVLIQAANESGWGTSRFATDALNFFGQWCWTEGCGLVPAARPAGQVYEVRRFASMEASVEAFIRNLNTHFAYTDLRFMRAEEREDQDVVTSATLTAGLMSYSERGQDYIDELNQMIRINRPIIQQVSQQVREQTAG